MVEEDSQGGSSGDPVPGLGRSLRARFERLQGGVSGMPSARSLSKGRDHEVPSSADSPSRGRGEEAPTGGEMILARERFTNRVARYLTLPGERREALLLELLGDVEVFRRWGAGVTLLDAALALHAGGEEDDAGREVLLDAILGPLVQREASKRLEGARRAERERLSRIMARCAGARERQETG